MGGATVPLFLLMLAAPATAVAQSATEPAMAVIPRPAKVTPHTGRFILTARTIISTDARSAPLGRQLARYLEPATGYTVPVRRGATSGSRIVLRRDATLKRLGDEGYVLDVRPGVVTVRASAAAGLFYGIRRSASCCLRKSSERHRCAAWRGPCRRSR